MWYTNKVGYINDLRQHSKERDLENRMAKTDLKKLKVATYTNKVLVGMDTLHS